uniref:Uncharacterized protein n=1 Tax=Anguilla anguilla TaxID=7936 RepID=A0A0E9XLV6_ANGAN
METPLHQQGDLVLIKCPLLCIQGLRFLISTATHLPLILAGTTLGGCAEKM